ncbi:MAG: hypothetical protein O7F73_06325 [Gammaproteobacteria bacterium]|nr:hypothetical protein [Gammaproteobacteria bacterium]
MQIRRVLNTVLVLMLCVGTANLLAGETAVLDRNLSALVSDFNQDADKVRLVFIVGPTCPVCREGLVAMKEDVLARVPEHSQLSIFVVHVPALEAREEDVGTTFGLFSDPRARQYWDEMGTSGIRFQRSLSLPTYAWDVWMIYPAGARWEAKDPPSPARWWHQLKGVLPEHRLDAAEFSTVLNEMLSTSSTVKAGAE